MKHRTSVHFANGEKGGSLSVEVIRNGGTFPKAEAPAMYKKRARLHPLMPSLPLLTIKNYIT